MNFVNEDEVLEDEVADMGSLYHGITQANLTGLLNEEKFAVIIAWVRQLFFTLFLCHEVSRTALIRSVDSRTN
jgi:hypothetical protein